MENQNQSLTPSQSQSPMKASEDITTKTVQTSGSTAAEMVAEQTRTEVQGAMAIAKKFPRNEEESRVSIAQSCKNLMFAERALYKKPVGKTKKGNEWVQNYVEGPSIRFAEEMLRHWGNVKTQEFIIYEDQERRMVRVVIYDLQSNNSYSEDILIEKTVERKNPFGREVVRERLNTNGEKIAIVLATEDEIRNKEKAMVSKAIRNNGLRLIPAHIVEDAVQIAKATLASGVNNDPMTARRKMLDSFAVRGIMPDDIAEYLGHPVEQITSAEMTDLKAVYNSIKDGEAKWSDFVGGDAGKEPEAESKSMNKDQVKSWDDLENSLKEGDPKKHTAVTEAQPVQPQK